MAPPRRPSRRARARSRRDGHHAARTPSVASNAINLPAPKPINQAARAHAIRDGALSFDELLAMAGDLQRAMEAAAPATQLPPDVDYERVDGLLVELLGSI